MPRRHCALITVLRALRPPFTEDSSCAANHDRAIIERRIFHERSREHSFFKRGRVNQRQHRSSGWSLRLQRAVVLVVFEIAAANQDQDVSSLVIKPNHRALQIFRRWLIGHRAVRFRFAEIRRVIRISLVLVIGMLFDPLKIRAQGIFSDCLKIDIDSGVNAKTLIHRAVPADCGDHLLADVIDGVGLPLRVLPAPGDDLFRLRTGAPFAADEIEIAHAIERVIARVPRRGAICPGRQSIWALNQTGEGGAFRERHLPR